MENMAVNRVEEEEVQSVSANSHSLHTTREQPDKNNDSKDVKKQSSETAVGAEEKQSSIDENPVVEMSRFRRLVVFVSLALIMLLA
ncbi:hypothetical protein EV175_007148, partial [Coemansia sp. RSA 1933]